MPCSEKRARKMLAAGQTRVHRTVPFVIRLVDRTQSDCDLQPLRVKLDPGSRTTGIALVHESEQVDRAAGEAKCHASRLRGARVPTGKVGAALCLLRCGARTDPDRAHPPSGPGPKPSGQQSNPGLREVQRQKGRTPCRGVFARQAGTTCPDRGPGQAAASRMLPRLMPRAGRWPMHSNTLGCP